jgi:hypothetical protein
MNLFFSIFAQEHNIGVLSEFWTKSFWTVAELIYKFKASLTGGFFKFLTLEIV